METAFNILNYGAVADGASDNSTPLQAAIDAAAAVGGGTVWLPHRGGKYKLATPIVLASNVWLMSDGATLDTSGFATTAPMIVAVSRVNVRVSGLRIEGDGNAVLISVEGCSNVRIDNNDLEITPVVQNVNSVVIRITDNPAVSAPFSEIWITNNRLKPSFLGILCQSRLSGASAMQRLFVLGNSVDYANIDAGTQTTSYGAAIKVDLNVENCIIAHNHLEGRGLCRDGINVQEDLHGCQVSANIVNAFNNYGIAVDAGQTASEVQNVVVSANIITGMIGATSRAISISCGTATGWKNVSVLGNILSDNAGYGIHENGGGDRVKNLVVSDNTISDGGNVGIYVRSHRAAIRNNSVQRASGACVQIVGSAAYCAVAGNRLDSTTTAINDGGVGTIRHNNIINDVWEA